MSSEPRRHDLVPQWYLKRFATEKEKIGVLDRGVQKRYVATVRTAGAEVGFYDVESDEVPRDVVEQLLGRVEAPASGATMKLTSSGPTGLSLEERHDVALFVATQFLRGADRRDFANTITDAIAKAHLVGATDSALRDDYRRMVGDDFSEQKFLAWRDFVRDPDNYRISRKGLVPQLVIEHAGPYAAFLSFEYSWFSPMRVLAENAKDLIEMAGKMRMVLDAGWKPGSGGAPTDNPIGPDPSAAIRSPPE